MRFKVIILSVFLSYSLVHTISLAQDKVVVIPLNEPQSARPLATSYELDANNLEDTYKEMIPVSDGDCFLTKVSITAEDGTSADDTNTCTIFVNGIPQKWTLKARASTSGSTQCWARCLKW